MDHIERMSLDQKKDFILDKLLPPRGPFIKCPSCGRDKYGVAKIEPRLLKRRCVKCGYPGAGKEAFEPLPRLNKKILYLDQFAFSNMMKSIHPKWSSKHSEPDFQLWKTCYAEISRLVQMQLVVCPISEFHIRESLVWQKMLNELKPMINVLSNGVEFRYPYDVQARQVVESFLLWQGMKSEREFPKRNAMKGNLDGWNDYTLNLKIIPIPKEMHEEAKYSKYEGIEELEATFNRWKSESNGNYRDWFNKEKEGYRNSLIQGIANILRKMETIKKDIKYGSTKNPHFEKQKLMHMEMNLVRHPLYVIQKLLIAQDHNSHDTAEIIQQFLSSKEIVESPHNMIGAALWGAQAHEARTGKKKMGASFPTDHNAIRTFLPYCDAMVVDKECKRLLEFAQKRGDIAYNTRFFRARDREELLEYLREIRQSATWEHKNNLKRVFGSDDPQPVFSLYEHNNSSFLTVISPSHTSDPTVAE